MGSLAPDDLAVSVGLALESKVVSSSVVRGGDICDAYRVRLADGRALFVKHHRDAPSGMFETEAYGLDWLRAGTGGGLVVPAVVLARPNLLVLEWLDTVPPSPEADEELGRGLAHMHRSLDPGSAFGLEHDNFLAVLPQLNAPMRDWSEFYWTRRLEPLLRRATDAGLATAIMRRGFERLQSRLAELVGPDEPPSRLHGDLWAGNRLFTPRGPALLDPAVYAGHREVDLAMMRLFGGFGSRVFAAYDEHHPLAPGAAHTTALYQLYPLLGHVCMFGAGYCGAVEATLGRAMST